MSSDAILRRGRPAGRWSACSSRWPRTVTLLSALLAAVVSPWFLLLTAFVGVNQWLYVLFAACPASLVLSRAFGLRSTLYPKEVGPR